MVSTWGSTVKLRLRDWTYTMSSQNDSTCPCWLKNNGDHTSNNWLHYYWTWSVCSEHCVGNLLGCIQDYQLCCMERLLQQIINSWRLVWQISTSSTGSSMCIETNRCRPAVYNRWWSAFCKRNGSVWPLMLGRTLTYNVPFRLPWCWSTDSHGVESHQRKWKSKEWWRYQKMKKKK